jgi:hypothetical protein
MTGSKKVFRVLRQGCRKVFTNPQNALLSARMAFWIMLVSVVARLTSLPRAQKIAAFRFSKASAGKWVDTPAILGQTIDNVLGIELFPFRRSCWKRALVLHRYLALIGVESQIKFGVRRAADGKVDGHAWLEHDGQPLLEENADNYVVTFSLPAPTEAAGPAPSY